MEDRRLVAPDRVKHKHVHCSSALVEDVEVDLVEQDLRVLIAVGQHQEGGAVPEGVPESVEDEAAHFVAVAR